MLLLGIARAADEPKKRELEVSGYGLIGNFQLERLLSLLSEDDRRTYYDSTFIEDGALILMSELERDGYLRPTVVARVVLEDGERLLFRWRDALGEPLPRPLRAQRVHYYIREGVRYHYDEIHFAGLETMPREEALGYFVNTRGLLKLEGNRVYTPQKAESAANSLQQAIEREGYPNATVTITNVVRDEDTGDVDLTVDINRGQRFIVIAVRVEEVHPDFTNVLRTVPIPTNQPYSQLWVQDYGQKLRLRRYQEGYPDATVDISVLETNRNEEVKLKLLAQVRPGPRIFVGQVRFVGEEKSKESAMARRVPLESGEPLNLVEAQTGRFGLARLGVFDSVRLRYDTVDAHTRDVIYEVDEGKTLEFSLLAGFGSYELLRGGFILEQRNVLGLAHHSRLKAVQSFKSSSGEYTYTIPQIGWGSDVFFNAGGLRRDEIDFTREELAASVGGKRYFPSISTDASLRYSYQYVNAARADFVEGFGVPDARVAAFILDLRHDRRDNPITPRDGYKLFSNIEVASDALGGEVDYQRVELLASYHWPIDRDRWIHLGAAHGAVFTVGGSAEHLPFNKRFFPGGENSIRGYQLGEASPRSDAGKIVGAESYLGVNFEFEQALTPNWSVVTFIDAMGIAQEIGQYPFDEILFSVGGGLRWNTILGPVRLEYGYNLNRRSDDPAGTLHFSVGFPF